MTDGQRCERCGTVMPGNAPEGLCPRCMLKLGIEGDPDQSSPAKGQIAQDRQLLFGVLAVQLRRVTPAQLVDVAGAWTMDPSRGLADRLVEAGVLSEENRAFLEDVVEHAIEVEKGDIRATLASFGGNRQVHESFGGSIWRLPSGEIHRVGPGNPWSQDEFVETVRAVSEQPGRYTSISEYSRGGMGRILLVHDEYFGRDIALKELLLPPPESSDGAPTPIRQAMPIMARFLQEARITGRLEHPGIVPVYELGRRQDGTVYYTMKLVRGHTLAKAIQRADSLEERLRLLPHFLDLCQAIAYAHSRGVIHRDLKPHNVMIGQFGETVVIDWGLAKALDVEDVHGKDLEKTIHRLRIGGDPLAGETVYGSAIGTPAYMSPEQAEGRIDEVDQRSDVYALGAVLYEILAGRPPFAEGTIKEVIDKVSIEEPAPIVQLEADAPRELVAVCERAMRKASAERYKTAQALSDEVRRILDRDRELRIAAEHARIEAEKIREQAEAERRAALLQKERAESRMASMVALIRRWKSSDASPKTLRKALIYLMKEGAAALERGEPESGRSLSSITSSARKIGFYPSAKASLKSKALMSAAFRNRSWALRALLAAGCDPNLRIPLVELVFGYPLPEATPLLAVAATNSKGAAKTLLDAGANPNLVLKDGWTALMLAVMEESKDVVRILLDAGADPNTIGAHGMTALMVAASNDNCEIVRVLLASGANPNLAGAEGATPLMVATQTRNSDVLQVLLASGADPNLIDAQSITAFDMALQMADNEIIEILRKSGARRSGRVVDGVIQAGAGEHDQTSQWPTHVGRYEIVAPIATGGMGTVYKAIDLEQDITVAIKVLDRRYDLDKKRRMPDYLGREVLIIAGLNHKNIIRMSSQIIAQADSEGHVRRCLIMEYLDGESLRFFVHNRIMPMSRMIHTFIGLASGLEYLHQRGIVHRDVKPENLLVSRDFRSVKVVDFGLSLSHSRWRVRFIDNWGGTRMYMSPEQLKRRLVDCRTDIFAFGITMYELFTGKHPCSGRDAREIQHQILSYKYKFERPSKHNTDIPPELDRIILKALERPLDKRYQTMTELLEDLRHSQSA